MPMDEAFDNLDKTKWSKYQHSKFNSLFWKSSNPKEEYRKLMKEIGFEEKFISLQDDIIRFPDLHHAKGRILIII